MQKLRVPMLLRFTKLDCFIFGDLLCVKVHFHREEVVIIFSRSCALPWSSLFLNCGIFQRLATVEAFTISFDGRPLLVEKGLRIQREITSEELYFFLEPCFANKRSVVICSLLQLRECGTTYEVSSISNKSAIEGIIKACSPWQNRYFIISKFVDNPRFLIRIHWVTKIVMTVLLSINSNLLVYLNIYEDEKTMFLLWENVLI